MKPTEMLADFIANTSWGDIPEEAVRRSKWAISDSIAVTFAGLQHEVGREIISFVKDLGGTPTSTILGDGHRTSAPWAAYANGTLAHTIDYDDMNLHIAGHPTSPIFSALLALGEKVRASGKEILLSYILGLEAGCKVGLALSRVHSHLGWHPTATLGTLGAAAACSKVLKLSKEQTLMALGIAGSQSSGLKQNFGAMYKPVHAGQAAKNGVLSALLASRGWTADREILEGQFGFCNLFAGQGSYDLKKMTENLGRPFDVVQPGIQFKKYPCCASTHASLDAIFKILQEHALRPEEVETVECEVDSERSHVLVHPNPKTGLEGKFSLEYCLATAILRGRITLGDFTDEQVADDKIKSFLHRIKPRENPALKSWIVQLRVKLRDGRTLKQEGDRSPGITDWDGLVTKYQDCLEGQLPAGQIQQSLQMIQKIDEMKDISELVSVLIPH